MEIREGAFIKATVNGKKAGFVVFNNKIWLLSYVTAWDEPSEPGYDNVPRHGFFKKKRVWSLGYPIDVDETTFEGWRNCVIEREDFITGFMRTIAFPGEDGYEREIQRRSRRNADAATEPATTGTETPSETQQPETTTVTSEAVPTTPDIDFYLPNYTTDNIYRGQHGYHNSHASGFLNQPNVPFDGHRIGVELEVVGNLTSTGLLSGPVLNQKNKDMTKKELYSEPILNVVNSDGITMMLPQTVVCAVIIDTLAYRASTRVTKDVQAAVKAALRRDNPEQPTKEIAAKMLKIVTRINAFWMEQCDETKQLLLDLTAHRYTEIAVMHK